MTPCLIVTPDPEYGRMLFLELSGGFDCVLLSGTEKTMFSESIHWPSEHEDLKSRCCVTL